MKLSQIHEIAHVTREQRREYKAKFLEVETDTSRMKERLETMNLMIDEIQEKLYEFEQNKKNNLIFHGILADHPETSDGSVIENREIFRYRDWDFTETLPSG